MKIKVYTGSAQRCYKAETRLVRINKCTNRADKGPQYMYQFIYPKGSDLKLDNNTYRNGIDMFRDLTAEEIVELTKYKNYSRFTPDFTD